MASSPRGTGLAEVMLDSTLPLLPTASHSPVLWLLPPAAFSNLSVLSPRVQIIIIAMQACVNFSDRISPRIADPYCFLHMECSSPQSPCSFLVTISISAEMFLPQEGPPDSAEYTDTSSSTSILSGTFPLQNVYVISCE